MDEYTSITYKDKTGLNFMPIKYDQPFHFMNNFEAEPCPFQIAIYKTTMLYNMFFSNLSFKIKSTFHHKRIDILHLVIASTLSLSHC